MNYKRILRWVLWLMALTMIFFMLYFQEWNMYKLSIAMRLKFQQIFNILLLWLPLLLFDAATEGRTLNILSMPDEPLEKLASSIFYGCMAMATAFCIVWGN